MEWIQILKLVEKYKTPLLIGLAILLFPVLFGRVIGTILRPFASVFNTAKDTGNSAAVEAQIKANPGTFMMADGRPATVTELDKDARAIFTALGLDKPVWNPSGWTEDEAAAVGVCLKYTKPAFSLLATRYQAINNRSLSSDLTEYLSQSDISKINHLWV